jgi:hypothetical protein
MIADVGSFYDAMLAAGVEVTRTHTGGLSVRGPALAVRMLSIQLRQRRSEVLAHLAALERAAVARVNVLRATPTTTTLAGPTP